MPEPGDELELTMKRLLIALLATSTMAFAVPALAQPHDHPTAPAAEQWNNGGAT